MRAGVHTAALSDLPTLSNWHRAFRYSRRVCGYSPKVYGYSPKVYGYSRLKA
jgi:hypothetical protein